MKKVWITALIVMLGTGCLIEDAASKERRISSDNHFGFTSRDYFLQLVLVAQQQGKDTFKRALTARLFTGNCTLFNAGEKVFITDTDNSYHLVKVRRHDETAEYWTNIETVK